MVHCLCNHLTEFGGGLLVAPNPIDFDKVWAGFGNISDNLAVLLTICIGFALYVLIGVLVRKKDKQDLLKVCLLSQSSMKALVTLGTWSFNGRYTSKKRVAK